MGQSGYWEQLVRTNPALSGDGKITLTLAEFRKRIERAYLAGKTEAEATHKVLDIMERLRDITGTKHESA